MNHLRIAMLHVDLPSSRVGGVAQQVSQLADALIAKGHDVTVFSFSRPPDGARYRGHTIRAPSSLASTRTGRLIGTGPAFAFRSYRPFDVVHAHGDSHLLYRHAIPVVRTFHGSALEEARHAARLRRQIVQRLLYRAERLSRKLATVTVGVSENTAHAIGALDTIIPCGVNRNRFRPRPKSERPTILFVGTVGGRKRGALVVDVFLREIRPRFPQCELWVVADERVTGDGIRQWGWLDDEKLARLFGEAWIFVLPSTYEGFGVPYIEAMASETPAVATPNPGANELLSEAYGGLVVDEARLGSTLGQLLANDGWRRELGRRGRQASKRFDWGTIAVEYEAVYRLALARCRRLT